MIAGRDRVYAWAAIASIAAAIWGSWLPFVIRPISAERAGWMLRWTRSQRSLRMTALVTAWLVAVFAVERWPFHFNLDVDRAYAQWAAWSFAPFRAPAAANDVVPGAILAIAGGAFLARHRHNTFARLRTLAGLALCAAVFATVEARRLLIEPTLTFIAVKVFASAITAFVASGWRAVMPSPTLS